MKNFIKSSKKWLLTLAICLSLSAIGSLAVPVAVSAGGDELDTSIDITVDGRYENVTQIGDTVTNTLSEWQETLVEISIAGFPVALIAMIGLIMFSRDPKKVAGLIGICFTMVIAFGAILLVNAGALKDIIVSIINGT